MDTRGVDTHSYSENTKQLLERDATRKRLEEAEILVTAENGVELGEFRKKSEPIETLRTLFS